MFHLVLPPFTSHRTPHLGVASLAAVLSSRGLPVRVHDWNQRLAVPFGRDFPDFHVRGWAERDPHHPGQLLLSRLLFPEYREARAAADARVAALSGCDDWAGAVARYERRWQGWLDELELRDGDQLGLTLYESQLLFVLYAAREIKRRNPETPVVVGGYLCHPELMPAFLEAFPWFDVVVCGEGEQTLPELLERSPRGVMARDVRGTIARDSRGKWRVNPPRPELSPAELDALPFPDFSWVDREAIRAGEVDLPILAGRGCCHAACRFCSDTLYWKRLRPRSVRRVVAELAYQHAQTGCRRFKFLDLTLNADEEWIAALCDGIRAAGRDLHLWGLFRADRFGPEMARNLAAAGFDHLQFGIEALSTGRLKRLGKGIRFLDALRCMKICKALGIVAYGNIITHYPGETIEQAAADLEKLWRFRDIFGSPNRLQTYPFMLRWGSPIYATRDRLDLRPGSPTLSDHLFPPEARKTLPRMEFRPLRDHDDSPLLDLFWSRFGKRLDELVSPSPSPCYFRDGERIRVERPDPDAAGVASQTLPPRDGALLDALLDAKTVAELQESLDWPRDDLEAALDRLVAAELIYEERGRYLALALPFDPESEPNELQTAPGVNFRPSERSGLELVQPEELAGAPLTPYDVQLLVYFQRPRTLAAFAEDFGDEPGWRLTLERLRTRGLVRAGPPLLASSSRTR